jgi:hypothetical protein
MLEDDAESVAHVIDLAATRRHERGTQDLVVPAQHGEPLIVAERDQEGRRLDDVGDHDRQSPPIRTRLRAALTL